MVWINHYRLHSILFHPDGQTAQVISGANASNIAANADILREVTAGSIYADTAVLQTLRPVGSFTTFNLNAALGTNGPGLGGPNSCITGDTNPGLNIYYARYGCAGPDAVAVDHAEYNVGYGVLVPTTLTVDHRGNATISYDIYARSDSGADPVVLNKVPFANLPMLTDNSKRWTMDAMSIGGNVVEGKRNISIAFNPNVAREGADSNPLDSVVSLDSMLQRITVQGVDPTWLDAIAPVEGGPATHLNTILYLKERNSAKTDLEHLRLTFSGLINWDTIATGDPTSPAGATIAIDLHTEGSTAPIVVEVDQAIP